MAAPGAAADVLRALLACPVSALLSKGEEALKAVLPKVFACWRVVCCVGVFLFVIDSLI